VSQLTFLNRSHFRKTYPKLGLHKPVVLNLDKKYDINRMVFDRNYLSVPCQSNLGVTGSVYYAEYEEGYIQFNNQTEYIHNFTTSFTTQPHTVVEIVPASGQENIGYVLYEITNLNFIIQTSANFTGWFKYYAVNSSYGYPTTVLSGSSYRECTAGLITVDSLYTISQSLTPSCSVNPSVSKFCLYDPVLDLGISFISGSITTDGAFLTGSFSTNYKRNINYINLV
jgi:hypothetical protein